MTQISWAPDSSKLVTVSRDRTWTLHRVILDKEGDTVRVRAEMMARSEKKSSVITRIIWSCAWTWDSQHFLTASRDKRLVTWGQREAGAWAQVGDSLALPESVTSVTSATRSSVVTNRKIRPNTENIDKPEFKSKSMEEVQIPNSWACPFRLRSGFYSKLFE